jgi:adenylate cyclase
LSPRYTIQVYHDQRLDFSDELDLPVELGRQRNPEETPFVRHRGENAWRIAIARLDEPLISRLHVRLVPASADQIQVVNLSDRNTIRLEGGGMIAGSQSRDLPLPLSLYLGERTIRVTSAVAPEADDLELQSLALPTIVPGHAASLSTRAPLAVTGAAKEGDESFVAWLQAVTAMLQCSASPAAFFERAAQGMVELISLDSGAVLLREAGQWKVIESRTSRGEALSRGWTPSSRILTSVMKEKRTYWQVVGQSLEGTASLGGVQAVVAAPILDERGEVIAVLYGDRHSGFGRQRPGGGDGSISKLEAMLVETFACSVAAGLLRIEQERRLLAAQVRFEQFFTPELASQLAAEPDLLRGRDAEVTLLFCDIRGFSRISERLGPAATGQWIESVLSALSDCIIAHKGVLVDYLGDELLAMWGSPLEQPDQAERACRSALDMWRALAALNAQWGPMLNEPIRIGIGINTGIARVGNTGSNRKFKYGPLGNAVNLASRVQGATKYLKAGILLTAATHGRRAGEFLTRRLCQVRVVNISEPVDLYELVSDADPGSKTLCARYEAALDEFGRRNFRQAAKILGNVLDEHPDDGPSVVLLSRVVDQLVNPSPAFDPVWDLPGK